jgi:hypothetical protein
MANRRAIIEIMGKELVTPGRLYAKLSGELRARQRCDGCHMPMVYLSEKPTEGSSPNWILEPSIPACAPCQDLIDAIAREHAARYDLWDPTHTYARPRWALFVPSFGSGH